MLEQHIHAYLRASAAQRTHRLGSFLVLLDEHDSGRYFNYAVPDDDFEPTAQDIAALIAHFHEKSRMPRLEYLPAACPALESALMAAGFTVETPVPILTCAPEAASAPSTAGITVLFASTDAQVRQAAQVQALAYGGTDATTHDAARLRRVIDGGGLVALAVQDASGIAVGSGQLGPPHLSGQRTGSADEIGGISEIAAIAVLASHRRRGIAAAVTAALTRSAPSVGVGTPFLMTVGAAEERVYQRVGYRRAARMLHISRP
ncbi:GNAT family N-acetyltransferase [Nocardia callitridis]|uniref:GNAT family N-acetyltransferase n=1 Tax=Nocardia callitridis TaxID=648753 RepID=A0ABP9K2W0_9NOCA